MPPAPVDDHYLAPGRLRQEPAPLRRRPVGYRLATAAGRGIVGGVRLAELILVTLTRPLPSHIADYRESARTALVVASYVIVGLTLLIAEQPEGDPTVLQLLGIFGALFAATSMMRPLDPVLNRCDGVVGLALIAALVAVSGGAESIYRPLLVLLLLYGALFYDTGRLVATGVLIFGAMVAPLAVDGVDAAHVAVLLVQVPVWGLTAGVVHTLVQRTRATARTDGLTGLKNHVTFHSVLQAEHERMLRYGSHYSVLLIDIDHFKRINDTYGHPVGDEVLRNLGRLLSQRARVTDTVARYGGEEFALLLPETPRDRAAELAEQLRTRVRDADLSVPVTVSIGIASSSDGLAATAEALLARADEALYEAKRRGRDRVAAYVPATTAFSYLSDRRLAHETVNE